MSWMFFYPCWGTLVFLGGATELLQTHTMPNLFIDKQKFEIKKIQILSRMATLSGKLVLA